MKVVTPASLAEALTVKAEHGPDAQVLAGGQSLSVLLHQRLVLPELLVYLGSLSELAAVSIDRAEVRLGAMVTMARAASDPRLAQAAPLLAAVCGVVASPHVRNLGTVVGNLCHAEVGSDPPQALLALDAEVCASSVRGERWIPVQQFTQGFFQTALADDEIATAVRFRPLAARTTYLKYRVRQMDLAGVGLALAVSQDQERLSLARIAVGGIGPRPLRATGTERALLELTATEACRQATALGALAADELAPTLSDGFGSAEYRRRLVGVALRRGLAQLLAVETGAA